MILPFSRHYPADAVERAVPDAASARAQVAVRAPALLDALEARRRQLTGLASGSDDALLDRCAAAVTLAYARLALRHGSWGTDFHAYHNEQHVLEIFAARIGRLIDAAGIAALGFRDWLQLGLFAACHDLRQRELPCHYAGVGANERASSEEAVRILDACGFDRVRDADFYLGIELAIAGSTFDARQPQTEQDDFNSAQILHSGGALAAKLAQKLDKHVPRWQSDARLVHAHALALIAADLDTANVADPFTGFVETGIALCLEREMRCRRSPDDPDAAGPVLGFLTDGQERFFFELHRFNSALGRHAFGAAKEANAGRLRALTAVLRETIAADGGPRNGSEVIGTLRRLAAELTRESGA